MRIMTALILALTMGQALATRHTGTALSQPPTLRVAVTNMTSWHTQHPLLWDIAADLQILQEVRLNQKRQIAASAIARDSDLID